MSADATTAAIGFDSLTSLTRLAVDTGGRMTEHTNDYTLAYSRAQRDLGCTYTVGFYVPEGDEDTPRNVTVRLKRRGLRAIHPSKYVFRSPSRKRESLLRAAWATPEMFQSGVVRAHVFPLRPRSGNSWDALLAVSFGVPLAGSNGANVRREFGAVLHRGSRMVHRFSRHVAVQANRPDVTAEPAVTFLEPVRLEPGSYTLTAVLSTPGEAEAHAVKVSIDVPEIPRKELFLVGPILGRPAGMNLVVTGGKTGDGTIGAENAFEPLLVQQLDESADLVALTQACFVGPKKKQARRQGRASPSVRRTLRREGEETVGWLEPTPLTFDGEEQDDDSGVRCSNLADIIPASVLPRGEFTFEIELSTDRDGTTDSGSVRFAIGSEDPPEDPPTAPPQL